MRFFSSSSRTNGQGLSLFFKFLFFNSLAFLRLFLGYDFEFVTRSVRTLSSWSVKKRSNAFTHQFDDDDLHHSVLQLLPHLQPNSSLPAHHQRAFFFLSLHRFPSFLLRQHFFHSRRCIPPYFQIQWAELFSLDSLGSRSSFFARLFIWRQCIFAKTAQKIGWEDSKLGFHWFLLFFRFSLTIFRISVFVCSDNRCSAKP